VGNLTTNPIGDGKEKNIPLGGGRDENLEDIQKGPCVMNNLERKLERGRERKK